MTESIQIAENNPEDKWFDTLHLKEGLKDRSIKGGTSTVSGQVASFILTTLSTIVLARLLLPQDYGLVAMVSVVTGFITLFKDLGLTSAIIQKDELTQSEVSSVFWANLLISLIVASVLALLSSIIASFYHEKRLLGITLIYAVDIFIVGISLQHNALMKRQMKFNALAFVQLLAVVISILTSVLLAWLGFGYWSLVFQVVTYSITQTVSLWVLCDWRPKFVFKASDANSILKFGAGVAGFDIVNHFSRNMDNVLVGKFSGSAALGLYSKAYSLLMLPIVQIRNPLNSVALPALSSLQKDEPKFRDFYARYLFILAFFSMPVVVFLGVFANELITIILGKQWIAAGPLFQILAIAAFIQPVIGSTGLILITTGKVKRYFNIGLMNTAFQVIGFVIGVVMGGVKGVAISQAVVVYIYFLPVLYYNLHKTPITVPLFLKEIMYPVLFSLISGAVMVAYSYYVVYSNLKINPILYCGFGLVLGALSYFGLMSILPESRKKTLQVLDMIPYIKKRKTAAV
jgi:O-antigen/teichoic acid export membrane protein